MKPESQQPPKPPRGWRWLRHDEKIKTADRQRNFPDQDFRKVTSWGYPVYSGHTYIRRINRQKRKA